jgi:hypothetical protein
MHSFGNLKRHTRHLSSFRISDQKGGNLNFRLSTAPKFLVTYQGYLNMETKCAVQLL